MKSRLALIVIIVAVGMRVAAQEKGNAAGSGFVQQAFAAWNSHDPDKVVTFYTEDVVYEDVAYGTVNHGRSGLRKFAAGFFEAVPDLKLEVVSSSVHNGHGVAEWVLSGTDKGLYKTGKMFSVRGASVFEMRGGKCSSNKDFYDFATIMRQVGALPPGKPVQSQASENEQTLWNLEHAYWRYVQDNNLAAYLSLWHKGFLGWPSVSAAPVRKEHITDWIALQTSKGLALKPVEFKPAAIQMTGDVAVTCYWMTYEWLDKDGKGAAHTLRITHTWLKDGKDWRIIGGMSMLEPATPQN